MGKTIVLNLSDVRLQGNVLDVGESFGVIYNISREIMDEISIDYVYAGEKDTLMKTEYNTCTMFFCLSRFWNTVSKSRLIEEVSKYIEPGGELFIWDINKEMKDMINNKIITILPSGSLKEFEFKNLNPLIKSNIEENEKLLEKYYIIEETKLWEDIHFIKARKI